MSRIATIRRHTKETEIDLRLNLDGRGKSQVSTGIHFFDHMLDLVARHGGIDVKLTAKRLSRRRPASHRGGRRHHAWRGVDREGTMRGANLRWFRELRAATKLPIVAAGGISSKRELIELEKIGMDAAVGMALYKNHLSYNRQQQTLSSLFTLPPKTVRYSATGSYSRATRKEALC